MTTTKRRMGMVQRFKQMRGETVERWFEKATPEDLETAAFDVLTSPKGIDMIYNEELLSEEAKKLFEAFFAAKPSVDQLRKFVDLMGQAYDGELYLDWFFVGCDKLVFSGPLNDGKPTMNLDLTSDELLGLLCDIPNDEKAREMLGPDLTRPGYGGFVWQFFAAQRITEDPEADKGMLMDLLVNPTLRFLAMDPSRPFDFVAVWDRLRGIHELTNAEIQNIIDACNTDGVADLARLLQVGE